MLKRFLETLNEADEIRSLYAFQDTDDVESVYAFDASSKKCSSGCHCGTLTDYEMDDSDDDSDGVESCNDFEGSNDNDADVYFNDVLSALYDTLIEPVKCGLQWLVLTILSYLRLFGAMVLTKVSAQTFWPSVFFSIWAYSQFLKANVYYLDNKRDITSEEVNSDLTETNPKDDNFETNETDDDIISVYAFDAINDPETPSTDVDEDTDDVASVYAFDIALNDNENYSANASEESVSSESSNTFGFTIPNLGEGEKYSYHADSDDGRFDFYNDNVTCVRLGTGKSLTLVFDGQNLKMVVHDGKVYTSFDAMPSEVAEILIAAREAIIGLVF